MVEQYNAITFVLGPTGSGKSKWALLEAQKNNGVILNADSIQIYKQIQIGAAKPTITDFKKAPHYLYDFVELNANFTAGDYRRAARPLIDELIKIAPVYVVGGSGFYIQALDRGMYEVNPVPEDIAKQVNGLSSSQKMWDELNRLDPKSAEKINMTDSYRLRRALELVLSEGRTLSEIKDRFAHRSESLKNNYKVRKIGFGFNREHLRERVRDRTENMVSNGLLDEVKSLLSQGYGNCKALRSVGYAECVLCLQGQLSRNKLIDAICISTMQLAKKQMTWFKRDSEIEWNSCFE